MSDIIFARPRHDYDSYQDLYKLITLSGFDLIYFDDIDAESDNTYILTMVNGENEPGWESPNAQIILWDLEWRDQRPRIPGVNRVWVSDLWYARRNKCEYVMLGSHPDLANGTAKGTEAIYNYAAMMYTEPGRRSRILREMQAYGLSVAMPAWGDDRHERLLSSQAMLHIHQHDNIETIAPLRWALAASYKLPVVSEAAADPGRYEDVTVFASYQGLATVAKQMVRSPRVLDIYADRLHGMLCQRYTFKSQVEASV